MEGRRPPDEENPFEWTDSPPRSGRRYSERSFDTGESDIYETAERSSFDPGMPGPEDPYESWREGTGEREAYDTGEREAYDTGEREAYDTGEREAYDSGEREAHGTGERERPRRRGRRGRRRDRRRSRAATAERRRARGDTAERRRAREAETARQRRHRRELPASVRRRQAGLIILIAAVVLIGGYVLAFGGGGGDDGERPLGLKRLAGQTIVARMDQGGPDKRLLRQARKGRIGGVFISPDEDRGLAPKRVRRDIARVQKAAREGDNPPLLVMTDQEGGFVKRLDGPPNLAPDELGEVGDPGIAAVEGRRTGQLLAPLGFNVDLAPLLDVDTERTADTIETRTFSDDPAVVAAVGVGFIEGLQSAGVSATAKHFPGLGLATENTDFQRVEISGSPEDQEAALEPFRAAIDAGVALVMVSSAIYPDVSQEPATFTREIVQGQLRDQLGFKGLIITDDLEARGIADVAPVQLAAVKALQAGNDLLLFGRSQRASRSVLDILGKAIKQGVLDREAVQATYDRIVEFKERLERE